MKNLLSYDDSDDQELYTISTSGNHHLTAATIAGSSEKPNEDAFAGTESFIGIFDGTTSAPIPALGKTSSARYASHFIKEHFSELKDTMTPKEAMLYLNKQLWETVKQLDGITLADTLTLPASTATILKVTKTTCSFAHIGDCFGIVYYKNGTSNVFTDDKNKQFDEKQFALIRAIAKEKNLSNRQARKDPRVTESIFKMYYGRNNHPNGNGSGLINGDPHLELYIHAETFSLQDVQSILLGTDGLLPQGWSLAEEKDRQQLLRELQTGGFKKLFVTKHETEDADPDWNYIRYKHSDDATGILITL